MQGSDAVGQEPETQTASTWARQPNLTRILAGLVALAAGIGLVMALADARGRADVIEAVRTEPGTVQLGIGSCNQEPYVDELVETRPGVYEVLVRTQENSGGEDCADSLSIAVAPDSDTITIVDRASGREFDLLGTGLPAPYGLTGTWTMTTVDFGNPVVAGVTNIDVPEITFVIDHTTPPPVRQAQGMITGNFGCNGHTIEVSITVDTITGHPETLAAEHEACSIPEGSGQPVLTETTLNELLSGEPAELFLNGDQLEIGTVNTNATFKRKPAN